MKTLTTAELTDAIRQADARDEIWAVMLVHADGQVETHDFLGNALAIADVDQTRADLNDWLLVPDPITCDVAVAAGLTPLNDCARCGPEAQT